MKANNSEIDNRCAGSRQKSPRHNSVRLRGIRRRECGSRNDGCHHKRRTVASQIQGNGRRHSEFVKSFFKKTSKLELFYQLVRYFSKAPGDSPPKYTFELTMDAFKVDSDGFLVVNQRNLDRDAPNVPMLRFQVRYHRQ